VTRYEELAAATILAGPTCFAPVIRKAIEIVRETREYHILVIIADGQIMRPSDTPPDELSDQERATIDAIVAASHYPLSIVVVGVGDGPWDMMREFDDRLPERAFDNFQFVDLVATLAEAAGGAPAAEPARQASIDAFFACRALQEVPAQFAAVRRLVGRDLPPLAGAAVRTLEPPPTVPRPPAAAGAGAGAAAGGGGAGGAAAGGARAPAGGAAAGGAAAGGSRAPAGGGGAAAAADARECPICLERPKDTALLPCGHLLCGVCAATFVGTGQPCPLGRERVTGRARVFL